nr:hypothetical protein [Pandoravirus massiliensis]
MNSCASALGLDPACCLFAQIILHLRGLFRLRAITTGTRMADDATRPDKARRALVGRVRGLWRLPQETSRGAIEQRARASCGCAYICPWCPFQQKKQRHKETCGFCPGAMATQLRRKIGRLLGLRRRRRVGRSYEVLADPYSPLLAELDALAHRPLRLCQRETGATLFRLDPMAQTFVRCGFDIQARTFAAPKTKDDDSAVTFKGRTHANRPWSVVITRADPRDLGVDYCARVRIGDQRYHDLVVCSDPCLLGSRNVCTRI